MVLTDLAPARINYSAIVDAAPSRGPAELSAYLMEELPPLWLEAYVAILPHEHFVQRMAVEGYEYLFDYTSALVQSGAIPADGAVEDRLVVTYGLSRANDKARANSRLRRRPRGTVDAITSTRHAYDRGHAIGHCLGGVLDLNIIPQIGRVNRGGAWRQMENYCLRNPGTYLFCRPLYGGLSSHPTEIELGVLKGDGNLWVQSFKNYRQLEELEDIERLYRGAIAGTGSKL